MKTLPGIALLGASALWGQPASPVWKEFSIGPPTRNHAAWSPNGIRAEGVPLKRAIARAYGEPENRIFGPDWIAETRYAITGIVDDPKDFQPLFRQELATQFHMSAHREIKVVPVFVLKSLDVPAKMTPSGAGTTTNSGGSDGRNVINYPQATVAGFANMLADAVGRPIIDETHMDGIYDFSLKWQPGSVSALKAAVKDQLGLELADERRAVELIVIDHIEKLQFSK